MDRYNLDNFLEKKEEDPQVDSILDEIKNGNDGNSTEEISSSEENFDVSENDAQKKDNSFNLTDDFFDETEEKSKKAKIKPSKNKNGNNGNKRKAIIIISLVIILIIVGIIAICFGFKNNGNSGNSTSNNAEQGTQVQSDTVLAGAKIDAAQYNYDKAIEAVKAIDGYDNNKELTELVATWENEKANLVEFPCDKVTHVFVHSLIYDTSLAFDGDFSQDGYNLVMTTVSEFNKMMQTMYERGYVLVSMKDICTFDSEGNRVDQTIMLPKDKKAFVLSQDDLCYYHTQDGDGIADKLIIDENGDVKCHYTDDKGNESIGDFDMVPIIDTFVKEHPDFSYHGRKGIIALTGYNGVLGYRTDEVYKTRPADELDPDQEQFLNRTPDFDFDKEVKEATKVADRMKETGWEFASHSWGHVNMTNTDLDRIKVDTEKFLTRVTPIIGQTDCLIYANGGDIAGVEEYDSNNEKYTYLLSKGFHVFCPVDSTIYWQQKGDKYFRMSRRNLDGYRMYHSPELLEDLFNVEEVFDKTRPVPVPDMSHYG
ncbi:MAG: polysaccharide deacetylase [Oscillospiraceae bacterium]|nr:polysaccharide deacetylase [Candidatus Ruminococcus equi]